MKEMIKIADIHVDRINISLAHISFLFPLTAEKIKNLKDEDLAWLELLITRFGKLQDYLGSKLINEYLKISEDYLDSATMIDKLNRLARLGVIESVDEWIDMRDARNHISHEYPDAPELTAKYLNQIHRLTPKLVCIYNNIKKRVIL